MLYRHGWQSWSQTGWLDPATPRRPIGVSGYRLMGEDPATSLEPVWSGAHVGALTTEPGRIALTGALGLDARVVIDGTALRGEGEVEWLVVDDDESAAFAAYAAALGDRLGRRRDDPGPVWCSWYSYYNEISQELVAAELAALGDLPFAVVQIDDGWQRDIGDWDPNPRFGEGMAALADRIRQSGRRPGLWLAPFLAGHGSALARTRPELLLRDESDAPVAAAFNWGGEAYALDPAHPGVVEHAAEACGRAVHEWGYSFLKLDFLYAAAINPRPDRERLYRRAVAAIRRRVGEDCHLLACGAPIVPSIGVFDAIRIGPDVAPFWENVDRVVHLNDRAGPGVADAIATSLGRLWLADLIGIDPDVSFFRSRYNLLRPEQRRLLTDLAHVCDRRGTSDPIGWLLPDERADLERFLVERPTVVRTGRWSFEIDGKVVDFTPIVESRPW
jgi:alpha-galactosidase